MATWIMHLRIAEKILNRYDIDKNSEKGKLFLAGNVGPDSGVPADGGGFNPPKNKTHWKNKMEKGKRVVDAEAFYDTYLKCNTKDMGEMGNKKRSYMLGYYSHLITDYFFSKMQRNKREIDRDYMSMFLENPNFIDEVKKDWYGIDLKYLDENAENIFNRGFLQIDAVPDYIEYFPKGALGEQIRAIKEFYTSQDIRDWVNSEFEYYSEDEMDRDIEIITKSIVDEFEEKEIWLKSE